MESNENIAPLLARYFSGNCTSEELVQVAEWKNLRKENAGELEQYRKAWEQAADFHWLKSTDTAKSWNTLQQQITSISRPLDLATKAPKNLRLYWISGIAASLILICMIAFFAIKTGTQSREFAVLAERSTAPGERLKITLPDGSVAWMNAGTKLRYPEKFAADKREVYLEGEAFFEVTSDAAKPFHIFSYNAVTTVVGTSFNVQAYPENGEVTVSVKTGKVALTASSALSAYPFLLEAGDKGVFNRADSTTVKSRTDAAPFAWMDQKLVFNQARMKDILISLERWYNVSIVTENEEMNQCRLSATFDKMSIDEVMSNLELVFGVTVTKENHIYKITGKGC